MATWMAHLRIADKLLDRIPGLTQTEFVMGNIAPDSGVPNEDWTAYVPDGNVSHFKSTDAQGLKEIHINEYVDRFYTPEQRKAYDEKQRSFYLGYLTHLLTDMMWAEEIVRPCIDRFRDLYEKDRYEWVWTMKKDWYDLDFLYLRQHPDFRAFAIYKNAVGFRNEYMDFFGEDAFDNRRVYITGFYQEEKQDLDREYPYLNEREMEEFVDTKAEELRQLLVRDYL